MSVRLVGALLVLTLPLLSGKLCGVPGRPVDGWFAPPSTEYHPGATIQYFCEPRNLIFGAISRTCQEDGSWSEDVPVCGKPTPVKEVFQSSTLGNLTAEKAVDGNYNSYSSTGLQEKGYWTAVLKNLEAIAAIRITFPAAKALRLEVLVTNGSTNGAGCGVFHGNTGIEVTKIFYCPPYSIGNAIHIQDYLEDPDSLQLKEVEVFAKKDAYCDPPQAPSDGTVNYDYGKGGVPFGGIASYNCSEGYNIQGKAIRKCVGQNIWSNSKPPKCIPVQCGSLSFHILNGRLEYSNLTFNSIATLQCDEGYRPTHSDMLTCQPNGRWSQSVLRCEPIRCENVEIVSHGRIELLDGSTFYGSRLRIICDHGFKLSGDEVKMCGQDGTWGDFNSICLETICPPFPLDVEGGNWLKVNGSDMAASIGVTYALRCHPGYELIGDLQFTVCLENGSWLESHCYCLEEMSPDPSMSSKEWSPKVMMMTAMGIGVGSAVCILCLVAGLFFFRRKSQHRNPPPVFHVGVAAKPTRDNLGLICNKTSTIDSHYYSTATAIYEEVQQRAPPLPKQRKPRSALPPTPPLDADAVYSQPFEEGSTGANKVTQDDDQTHIYAEPVDTCSLSSECQQNLENQRKDESFYDSMYDKPVENILHMENSVIYETAGKPIVIDLDMISNDIYLETK